MEDRRTQEGEGRQGWREGLTPERGRGERRVAGGKRKKEGRVS